MKNITNIKIWLFLYFLTLAHNSIYSETNDFTRLSIKTKHVCMPIFVTIGQSEQKIVSKKMQVGWGGGEEKEC